MDRFIYNFFGALDNGLDPVRLACCGTLPGLPSTQSSEQCTTLGLCLCSTHRQYLVHDPREGTNIRTANTIPTRKQAEHWKTVNKTKACDDSDNDNKHMNNENRENNNTYG